LVPIRLQKSFNLSDSDSPTNKIKPPFDFNVLMVVFGLVVKVHLWTSRLVFTSQKRAIDTQQRAETTDKYASWDDQDHGPFPFENGGRNFGGRRKSQLF
jgi:hypothetical protein